MYTDYTEENETYYDDENNNQDNQDKFKKLIIYIVIGIVALILILVMAKGCSKKNNKNSTQVPTVVIGMKNLSLGVGETYSMQFDVLNSKASDPAVKWESDDPSIASVDEEGLIKGEAEGTTTVTATYTENKKTYTDTCEVVVKEKTAKLEGINLKEKELFLKIGDKVLIEYTTVPVDAKVEKLVYESDNTSVASVDENGNVSGVGEGNTKITVKTEDGSISSSINVLVSKIDETPSLVEPTEIKILGLADGVAVGKSVELVFDIVPADASIETIKWTSSNSEVAKVELVDGKVTVTGVGVGKCTINATTEKNVTASLEVEIGSDVIEPTEIKISGSTSISMKVKETKFLSYTLLPENVTEKKVTYTSSNKSVVFVDSNGIMAAVGKGTAKITITTSNGKTAEVTVTVK